MNLRDFKTSKARREALERHLNVKLLNIANTVLADDDFSGHCENSIGAAQMPVGVAGPLKMRKLEVGNEKLDANNKDYYIPLATTEGALVASVNRGCKAITESGGAAVFTEHVGTTRGPVFITSSLRASLELKHWLEDNFDLMDEDAQKTSSHTRLKKIGTRIVGRNVYIRFYFDTSDAMGMNMVTIATNSMVRTIELKTGAHCVSLAGNFDIDKKAAWLNSISGRGRRVWAEAVVSKQVVKDILKTTPQKIFAVWLKKCLIGSAMSGSLGFNAHFANIIAALFIATGQDPAHVVEGSMGITTTELLPDGDVNISIYLPALMVGTVGGGTGLPTQKEALKIMAVAGVGKVEEFAEIVGAAVLAGEISLLASLAKGSLARTHEKFRKSKVKR